MSPARLSTPPASLPALPSCTTFLVAFRRSSAVAASLAPPLMRQLPASPYRVAASQVSASILHLQPFVPFLKSAFSTGTSTGRMNLLCLGSVGGILFFSDGSSKQKEDKDPFGLEEEFPEGEDPMESLKKLLKKIAVKLSKFPVPDVKAPIWYVGMLEKCLGKNAAGHVLTVARFLRRRWSELCLVLFTGGGCWSLQINVFEGAEILSIIIEEKRDRFHRKLASYARVAKRRSEGKEEAGDAQKVVVYSVYDLTTQEAEQYVILSRGIDEAALRELVEDAAKRQPPLPKAQLHPAVVALLKRYEDPAPRQMAEDLYTHYGIPRRQKKPSRSEYHDKAIPSYQNKGIPGIKYGLKSVKSAAEDGDEKPQ